MVHLKIFFFSEMLKRILYQGSKWYRVFSKPSTIYKNSISTTCTYLNVCAKANFINKFSTVL